MITEQDARLEAFERYGKSENGSVKHVNVEKSDIFTAGAMWARYMFVTELLHALTTHNTLDGVQPNNQVRELLKRALK